MVAMPPGYRERAQTVVRRANLTVKVLEPVDSIVAKLRRFTEEHIADALFVARKFQIAADQIARRADDAVQHSIKDTALFLFQGNVRLFLERMASEGLH